MNVNTTKEKKMGCFPKKLSSSSFQNWCGVIKAQRVIGEMVSENYPSYALKTQKIVQNFDPERFVVISRTLLSQKNE